MVNWLFHKLIGGLLSLCDLIGFIGSFIACFVMMVCLMAGLFDGLVDG